MCSLERHGAEKRICPSGDTKTRCLDGVRPFHGGRKARSRQTRDISLLGEARLAFQLLAKVKSMGLIHHHAVQLDISYFRWTVLSCVLRGTLGDSRDCCLRDTRLNRRIVGRPALPFPAAHISFALAFFRRGRSEPGHYTLIRRDCCAGKRKRPAADNLRLSRIPETKRARVPKCAPRKHKLQHGATEVAYVIGPHGVYQHHIDLTFVEQLKRKARPSPAKKISSCLPAASLPASREMGAHP